MKFTIKKSTPPAYTETTPSVHSPPDYDEYYPETCHACKKSGFDYNCGNNSMEYNYIDMNENQMECNLEQGFVCFECVTATERNTPGFKIVLYSDDVKNTKSNDDIMVFTDWCIRMLASGK